MTPAQFALINRSTASWLTLWLVVDFETGRAHAVSSMVGGTWHHNGERGQYETTGKGMAGWTEGRDEPAVVVTWGEVQSWVKSLPGETREQAAALSRAGRALQQGYPSPYPGIGRPYAWDRPNGCTPEERQRDMADLDAANAKRAEEVAAWQVRKRDHDNEVAAFIESLTPEVELDVFGMPL